MAFNGFMGFSLVGIICQIFLITFVWGRAETVAIAPTFSTL